MREVSIIIIILIYRKLGSVGAVQQKIKLPLPLGLFALFNHTWTFTVLFSEVQF